MHFIEFERFGWNWLTLSFISLFIVTSWQYRGYTLQASRIWKMKSVQSLSIIMATSLFFVMAAILWYGIVTRSFTLVYTGGLCVPSLFIMLGAWKFGRPNGKDILCLAFCTGGLMLYSFPINPAWILMGYSLGSVLPLTAQLFKLYKVKARGVLHGEWLATSVIKNVLLNIFAFTAQDLVYMVMSPIFLTLTVWLTILWLRYGNRTEVPDGQA
jgi:hypothetical protein